MLRASGIHWVIIGGDHTPGPLKADADGGVHYGLGDFIFGCECSGATTGKELFITFNSAGFKTNEINLTLASPDNGYLTTFSSSPDF
jgi:hypothetical protein